MKRVGQVVKDHWQLMVLTGIIYLLWPTDLIWPLRILIVLFHELSHAAVAILTGGDVLELSLSRNEGGFVRYRGGSFFWTATAGYLGSLLIGVFLLLMAMRTQWDRGVLMGLGAIILITTLLFVRDGFAFLYMALIGGVFVGVGYWLPMQVSDLVLRVIGLVSMLYVPWDIVVDTIFYAPRSSIIVSDAAAIANRYGLTEGLVGIIWVALSVVVIVATVRTTLRSPSNIAFKTLSKDR